MVERTQRQVLRLALAVAMSASVASCSSPLESHNSSSYPSKHGYTITLTTPKSGATVASPLTVRGTVKGSWSFEAEFPVEVADSHHKTLGKGNAKIKGDWATEKTVPFSASVPFKAPANGAGFLIISKANPADDRTMDDSVEVPITFAK